MKVQFPLRRIDKIECTVVSVPSIRPCAWSRGVSHGTTRTIIELHSNSGIIGVGEAEGAAPAAFINHIVKPALLKGPLIDTQHLRALCRVDFADAGSIGGSEHLNAYAAVEMAMIDAIGKEAGLPAHRFLGGMVRPLAMFGAYSYTVSLKAAQLAEKDVPEVIARYAVDSLRRTGADLFEFKIGRFSVETDIATILAVRSTIGNDVLLAVDANQAYVLSDARNLLRATREARIDWFEEPTASFDDMARLHAEFGIAISSHCADAEKYRHFPEIEAIVGDLHLSAGMTGVNAKAATAAALGRRFWQRSSMELGVSWAAMVHVGCSCPDMLRPSQCLIDWVEDDLILGPTWGVTAGGVAPPEKPGLGVDLDRDALARYAEHYRSRGDYTYFETD